MSSTRPILNHRGSGGIAGSRNGSGTGTGSRGRLAQSSNSPSPFSRYNSPGPGQGQGPGCQCGAKCQCQCHNNNKGGKKDTDTESTPLLQRMPSTSAESVHEEQQQYEEQGEEEQEQRMARSQQSQSQGPGHGPGQGQDGEDNMAASWTHKAQYYLPCLLWIPNYSFNSLLHDAMSGLSLASFQIPLAMSYAKTIANLPPIAGLCAIAIPPVIYAIFGSVPQLIVGPEPSISIVVGGAIEPMLHHDKSIKDPLDLVLCVTVMSGFTLLGAGLARLGYLDNLLSPALLKGFIAAVGVVMVVGSGIEELGLKADSSIHSPIAKLYYMITHLSEYDPTTTKLSLLILLSLIFLKIVKNQLLKREYKKALFLPDILIVVLVTTCLSYIYDWESNYGIRVTGKILSDDNESLFEIKNPFNKNLAKYYTPLLSTGITCAILGFFESTTASKAMISEIPISSNRELVALGFINLTGGMFGALPAFGGFGRSKINALSGGKTCASGMFMSIVTILVIYFLLDFLYFLPTCCLSCITTIIGFTILEEIPSELIFFIRTRGYEELFTFCVTFLAAFCYSMDMGIIVGTVYSLVRILKNSSQSNIQIADQEQDHSLIVKITEPLVFTNTNDLKLKLRRLEMYGSTNFHPATPRFKSLISFIIFDISEMRDMDSSGAKILLEIIHNYHKRHIKILMVNSQALLQFEHDNYLESDKITTILIRSKIVNYLQTNNSTGNFYFESVARALKTIEEQYQNGSNDNSDVISYQSTLPVYV